MLKDLPTQAPQPPEPEAWLGRTEVLDLEDPRLRLRVQSLVQLARSDRERALTLYGFVKRLPFHKPVKLRMHTAREVLDAGRGDAEDKASLLLALLRCAGLPARLRYVELHGAILRGLTDAIESAGRPVLEVWLDGRWAATDTFIFDARYIVAARARLVREGWDFGYGIHRDGDTLWTGQRDAFLAGDAEMARPVSLGSLGLFHDPLDFVRSEVYQSRFPRMARAVRWALLTPGFNRAVQDLRQEPPAPPSEAPAQA